MKVFKNLLMVVALLGAPSLIASVPPIKIGRALLSDFDKGKGDVSSLVRFYSLTNDGIRDALAYLSALDLAPAQQIEEDFGFYLIPSAKPGLDITLNGEARELGIDPRNIKARIAALKTGLQHEINQRSVAAKTAAEAPFLNANEMELVAFLKPALGIGKYPPAFEFERANSAQLRKLLNTIESVVRSNLKVAKMFAIADELRKSDPIVTNSSAITAMQTLLQQLPNQIARKQQAERVPAQVPTQPRRY